MQIILSALKVSRLPISAVPVGKRQFLWLYWVQMSQYLIFQKKINSMIDNGFVLKRFDEHPSWENEKLPGEFTAIAIKN